MGIVLGLRGGLPLSGADPAGSLLHQGEAGFTLAFHSASPPAQPYNFFAKVLYYIKKILCQYDAFN